MSLYYSIFNSDKRISQHLSGLKHAGPAERSVISVRPFLPKEDEPPKWGLINGTTSECCAGH